MKWYELAGIGVAAYLLLGSAKKAKRNPIRNPINWTYRDAVLSVMPTMYPLQVHNIARRTGMSRDEARKVLGGLVRSGHVISTNEGYKKIKNPGAAWHEEQAKHTDRLISVSKKHGPYFMGARDADMLAAGVSRQKGMPNPRRRHRK